jgi:predicted nucleic acid binding AN1-type Zn finger protein
MECPKKIIEVQKTKCFYNKCNKNLTSTNYVICPKCRKKFCIKHRFEDNHECNSYKQFNNNIIKS